VSIVVHIFIDATAPGAVAVDSIAVFDDPGARMNAVVGVVAVVFRKRTCRHSRRQIAPHARGATRRVSVFVNILASVDRGRWRRAVIVYTVADLHSFRVPLRVTVITVVAPRRGNLPRKQLAAHHRTKQRVTVPATVAITVVTHALDRIVGRPVAVLIDAVAADLRGLWVNLGARIIAVIARTRRHDSPCFARSEAPRESGTVSIIVRIFRRVNASRRGSEKRAIVIQPVALLACPWVGLAARVIAIVMVRHDVWPADSVSTRSGIPVTVMVAVVVQLVGAIDEAVAVIVQEVATDLWEVRVNP
jgi:hypothetical protein